MPPLPPNNPDPRHRKSIRLPGYDYATNGAYFITLVTQGRALLFADVSGDRVFLSPAGILVHDWWHRLPTKFPELALDEVVVMPNHMHGIVWLSGGSMDGSQTMEGSAPSGWLAPTAVVLGDTSGQTRGSAPTSLATVVQWFKTMTTNEYFRGVREGGWPAVRGRLWQRNYYEHVVRDDADLERIREYILANPAKWAEDQENPTATP